VWLFLGCCPIRRPPALHHPPAVAFSDSFDHPLGLERGDEQDEVVIDPSAVAAALEKLKRDPEPEARFMQSGEEKGRSTTCKTAVDGRTRADRGASSYERCE